MDAQAVDLQNVFRHAIPFTYQFQCYNWNKGILACKNIVIRKKTCAVWLYGYLNLYNTELNIDPIITDLHVFAFTFRIDYLEPYIHQVYHVYP